MGEFYSPRSSGKHCEACGRVFAEGFLPRDGTLICRDCRAEQTAGEDPALFSSRSAASGEFVPMRPSSSYCEPCGRVFAEGFLPTDGILICRDCRAERSAGDYSQHRQRPPSSTEFTSPRASSLHCESCDRVFAAGFLPTDGTLICRDCRAEQTAAADPALF